MLFVYHLSHIKRHSIDLLHLYSFPANMFLMTEIFILVTGAWDGDISGNNSPYVFDEFNGFWIHLVLVKGCHTTCLDYTINQFGSMLQDYNR
ncbi:hypothetical protein L204_106412 [Cryptococcus depauperatus]